MKSVIDDFQGNKLLIMGTKKAPIRVPELTEDTKGLLDTALLVFSNKKLQQKQATPT